jgi:hypothetical protein
LVHASVGEEQCGIVHWDAGTALPEAVTMFLHEEVNEGTADFLHGPFQLRFGRHGRLVPDRALGRQISGGGWTMTAMQVPPPHVCKCSEARPTVEAIYDRQSESNTWKCRRDITLADIHYDLPKILLSLSRSSPLGLPDEEPPSPELLPPPPTPPPPPWGFLGGGGGVRLL